MSIQSILTSQVNEVDYLRICDRIQTLTQTNQSAYVIAANVHVIMTAYWNAAYRSVVDAAAIVTPDGMPIVWGMRWLGAKEQTRVYGPDLMLAWCDRAAQTHQSIYLYGGTPETLQRLSTNLKNNFPKLRIAGVYSPPFRPLTLQEEEADRARIHRSGASVVFVGLGCPKQEEWMYRQVGKLNAVMIGVGAAFKFHSGEVKQAPRWMMQFGLEWLYRLTKEPKRLWSRYLFTNIAFIVLFAAQMGKHIFSSFTQRVRSVKSAG